MTISLVVLSEDLVTIAQWENDCISLSVHSVARVIIAQWENECISLSVLSVGRVQFPAVTSTSREFSLADHTLPTRPESAEQNMAQSPLNLWSMRRQAKA